MNSQAWYPALSRGAMTRLLRASIFLAFAFALISASSASAAFTYANDESGANDYPGQKDLTRHGVDPAGLPASIQVSWNWDETNWSGGNTGDACVLFDSDADGNVNYAYCTIVEGAPAALSGTVLYSCSDNKVDRCTAPLATIPIVASSCSVNTTATDPFPIGDEFPNDTTALCNIVLSDIGAPTLTLVNTCSYPSSSPNSAPSDCVLIPRDGFLIINKIATPNDAAATFDFSLDSGATPVFTANGSETSGVIPVRTDISHTLAESMPSLWTLDSASCSNGSGTFAGSALSGITVAADATVTCTFNNSFAKASPTISTQASGSVAIGGSVSDSATLAAGFNPTGLITFSLYGPNDATCAGPAVYTTNVAVAGNGVYNAPSFTPTSAGTYRWIASYGGDANNNAVSGACNDANESVIVTQAAPTIVTVASTTVEVGGDISDTATLAGGSAPTGLITFNLYGPDDGTCANAPVFTTSEVVNGNGVYTSDDYTALAAGTYRWVASYGGDVNNAAVSGACNDANESVVVSKAAPRISTNASATVVVGNDITDTAALAGSYNATGNITFNLYGPDDATCANPPVFTATEPVAGDGNYTSNPYTALAAGTYRWIASYAGDSNNVAVSGACNDANESVVVSKASPTISTQASPTVPVGNDIYDVATLAGGYNPTGLITFTLYAPGDVTCTTAIYTTSEVVNGNGNYTADDFLANTAGTYRWIASYGGDANNAAVSGACNDANESVVVSQLTPSISTVATPAIDIGSTISDTATIAGGFNPTGTITFNLYAPGDATCTTSIFTDVVNVNGNGDYTSDAFTPTAAGEFRWIAAYSGDVNNAPATGTCGDKGESSVVSQPAIELSKTASATSVAPGTPVTFTLTVTNAGDVELVNVDLSDTQCSPLTLVSGDLAPIGVLDVGESWVFTCTKTITTSTVNVATVGATSPNQTTVTDTATATVNVVAQPVVQQLSAPTVRVASSNKCKSRRFRITPRISGSTPRTSVLRIDGRREATSRSRKPSFVVDSRDYSAGRHRYTVTITFTDGQQVVASGRFSRCATTKSRVSPQFTG